MRRLQDIRAVSFDVGGTLIEPWPSVGHVYAEVAKELGLPPVEPARLNERFRAAWKVRQGFDYSRADWLTLVQQTFDFAGDSPVWHRLFPRLYDRFADGAVWRIYDDVYPTLEELRRRGLKLAAVSNWDERLRPLLQNLGLDRFFTVIEISGESGFHKPSVEIFRRALTRLQLNPAEVVHVGDSVREDLEGAQNAGWHAFLLRRGEEELDVHEIGSLAEIGARLA